jgi:hypothetical protein
MSTPETDFRPEDDIGNAKLVTDVFGEWPSFHDAEILRITLQREPRSASLVCVFHLFKASSEIDETGHFVLRDHTLVTLLFGEIDFKSLTEFNHQNVIDNLNITGRRPFLVDIPANNGCDATFSCETIDVLSVAPYDFEHRTRDGSIYGRREINA